MHRRVRLSRPRLFASWKRVGWAEGVALLAAVLLLVYITMYLESNFSLLLQRERGLNRNTCIGYVEVWELKLCFYPSAGG